MQPYTFVPRSLRSLATLGLVLALGACATDPSRPTPTTPPVPTQPPPPQAPSTSAQQPSPAQANTPAPSARRETSAARREATDPSAASVEVERSDEALARERRELEVARQVRDRVARQAADAEAGAAGNPEDVQRLQRYLEQVEQGVLEQEELVRSLEQAAAAAPPPSVMGGAAMTDAERVEALERDLEASLGEFDAALLEETRTLDDPLGAGAGGAPGSGGSGSGGSQSGSDGSTAEEQGVEGASEQASAGASVGGAGGRNLPPPDIGDGSDDDIVARQIRRAAEAETDPEIRAKLWEEYRRYKRGTGT